MPPQRKFLISPNCDLCLTGAESELNIQEFFELFESVIESAGKRIGYEAYRAGRLAAFEVARNDIFDNEAIDLQDVLLLALALRDATKRVNT